MHVCSFKAVFREIQEVYGGWEEMLNNEQTPRVHNLALATMSPSRPRLGVVATHRGIMGNVRLLIRRGSGQTRRIDGDNGATSSEGKLSDL